MKTVTETQLSENALQSGIFWKRSGSCVSVWTVKPELFENDDVSVSDPAYPRERNWRDMLILHKMKYTSIQQGNTNVKCKNVYSLTGMINSEIYTNATSMSLDFVTTICRISLVPGQVALETERDSAIFTDDVTSKLARPGRLGTRLLVG